MKETTARATNLRKAGMRSRLRVAARESDGIEVQEEELGAVTAQRLYRMRCECGRSWFELELPKLVKCPACLRLNLVQTTMHSA
jgi:hypothetical protein